MSTWIDEGFIAFDTETTGVDTAEDRIVTAAAVLFRNGEPQETRSWLIKVDVDIPERASEVHGITNEISQGQGQDQTEALAEIGDYLDSAGFPIVCFNTGFDIPILNSNLRRHGLGELKTTMIICPYVLDRQLDKYVKGKNQRRLKPTAERYGLELSEHSHRAGAEVPEDHRGHAAGARRQGCRMARPTRCRVQGMASSPATTSAVSSVR
jgi:DNA polymerase-3 subunit epsilon